MNKIKPNISISIVVLLVILLAGKPLFSQPEMQHEYRTVPDSVKTSYRNDKDFAYANDPSYWKKVSTSKNSNVFENFIKVLQSPLVRWIVYLLLLAIFIFVIYRILLVLGVFDRSAVGKKKLTPDHELSETSQQDLLTMLENALNNGEHRLATRYHYLHLLKILADKNMIQLHSRSTNRDYVNQVKDSSIALSFKTITRIYEYVWYGEAYVSEDQFKFIDQHFKELKSSLYS